MTLQGEIKRRKGVSQYKQPHIMLQKGLQLIEQQFPGYMQELSNAGALPVDHLRDIVFVRTCFRTRQQHCLECSYVITIITVKTWTFPRNMTTLHQPMCMAVHHIGINFSAERGLLVSGRCFSLHIARYSIPLCCVPGQVSDTWKQALSALSWQQ